MNNTIENLEIKALTTKEILEQIGEQPEGYVLPEGNGIKIRYGVFNTILMLKEDETQETIVRKAVETFASILQAMHELELELESMEQELEEIEEVEEDGFQAVHNLEESFKESAMKDIRESSWLNPEIKAMVENSEDKDLGPIQVYVKKQRDE